MDEAPPARAGRRRGWGPGFWLKFAVSAGLFAWIVWRTDLAPVLAALSETEPGWFALAFAAQILGASIIALRWRILLAAGGVRPGYPFLVVSTLSSLFVRQFMPSVIGGDALRAHDAWRVGASSGFALMSLFVDRLLGLLALAVFAFAALAVLGSTIPGLSGVLLPLSIGTAAALLILAGLLFGRRGGVPGWVPSALARMAGKVADALRVYRGAHGAFARAALCSLLLQVNVVTFYWMLSRALSLEVPYATFYAIIPLAIFVMMLPISINGIGLRETAFVFLLGVAGVAESDALAFAWLEFGLVLLVGAFGGLVYLFRPAPPTASPREPVPEAS
ncbi:lysylphosphatidylglycerol synthase transmembrane domain-containing protein [Jannaschia sp. W003]|uniref:lysylphosphatidylglycerol synthase transmembrane domain-containing protein n=1 Tax=Jannaschia sp. W003 TaxID=2867012 RepID=UPI0021A3839E|nr:lysylphosphatidylglycerol synthase transmembrane domain-containing protein [Jannaschia sp. W003]UWQ21563.1 flippase-like domain-containing protein [Jannaschia sp. W003]